jgi:hypothetical protein
MNTLHFPIFAHRQSESRRLSLFIPTFSVHGLESTFCFFKFICFTLGTTPIANYTEIELSQAIYKLDTN